MGSLTTLKKVQANLNHAADYASSQAQKGNFEKASDTLILAIGRGRRDLHLAQQEHARLSSGYASSSRPSDSDQQANLEEAHLRSALGTQVAALTSARDTYNLQCTNDKIQAEAQRNKNKEEEMARKGEQEQDFVHGFTQLSALKQQREPRVGVDDELTNLLAEVKRLKREESVSTPELTRAMNAAYERLTGGSKEEYDNTTSQIYNKGSIPMKALGSVLLALGIALAASGIFFAPAVILSGAGLATIYAATLATAAVSSALLVGSAACFFKKTPSMQLADKMHPLTHEGPAGSDASYQPVSELR